MTNPSSPFPRNFAAPEPGTVGIAGAGLMGRLLAFMLSEQGWRVSLFDRDEPDGARSCGHTGAGMLAPASELESAEPLIAQLGVESLALWEKLLARLHLPVFFQKNGTLIVAHPLDTVDLEHFRRMLQGKLNQPEVQPLFRREAIRWQLSPNDLQQLEPQLGDRFQAGVYLPDEGQIDNRQLLPALAHALTQQGVVWHTRREIQTVGPHQIKDSQQSWCFDWAIDCRGLGAQTEWRRLRGVRGEIIRVYAPNVTLNRPIRLMHPRHPLYIVPREEHHFLIGATSLESEDFRPITAQSAMELLSAAFTVHPGLAEASILETAANCRPALADNLPRIQAQAGLIRINGLYRHGFLISPALAKTVCDFLTTGQPDQTRIYAQALFETTDSKEAKAHAVTH